MSETFRFALGTFSCLTILGGVKNKMGLRIDSVSRDTALMSESSIKVAETDFASA